ncbi:MAG: SDR family NAD(P)-dependent oxidoreductase, partial [Bacteroidota bacterium]
MAENKEYVIITGASSGIGLEFAKIFAEKGYNLILISLNINDLQEVHNSILKSHQCDIQIYAYDLIEKENIKSIFVSLKSKGIMAKTLINNAGFANYGEFISVDIGK